MREVLEQQAEAAAKAAAAPLWSLTDEAVVESLRVVHRWEKHLAGLKARLVQEITGRGIPARQGHRRASGWLRAQLLIDPQPARELLLQAAALRTHPTLEQAVIDGRVDVRQSIAIADALDAIPATLRDLEFPAGSDDADDLETSDLETSDPETSDPETSDPETSDPDEAGPSAAAAGRAPGHVGPDVPAVLVAAEETLVEMASRLPAYQLRRVGERILAHIAPEVAERADAAALRRAEDRQQQSRTFTLFRRAGGAVRIAGFLDAESAAIVSAALQPLCQPTPNDDRTPGQQRADALVDICRLALRGGQLPEHGGEPSQLAVTVPFDPLTRALGAGTFDNGEKISAATARRLACDARLLPLVLGGESQILDAGRTRRLAHGPLRRALSVRDRGCAFPDCDRPPRWCDCHHLIPWTRGGPTSLDNLVLLCRHHHRLLHDPRHGWEARLGPDRLPEFIPPPWTDASRRPRRNLYHPRT